MKTNLNECFKGRGAIGGFATSRGGSMRHWLVSAEIALSLMLLVGAGLFLKSFVLLGQSRLGFEPKNALTVELGGIGRPVNDELIDRLSSLPGVKAVGITNYLPISESDSDDITVEGGLPRAVDEKRTVYQKIITPDYFRAMGIPLLKGRSITKRDIEGALPVVVVNETFVRCLLGQTDPIGKRLADNKRHMIVGVVGDTRDLNLEKEAQPQVYYSFYQKRIMQAKLVIRTEAEPMRLAGIVHEVIRSIEKDRPIFSIRTMEERISHSIMPQQFHTILVTLFSAVGLILAALGIYGVISYSVAQRIPEFGIRMALGARSRDVLTEVLRQGLALTIIGLAIGLLGAFTVTHTIRSLLYNVSYIDPVTYVSVCLILTSVALLACYIPARRAAKIDPMKALRCE